jgi:hypothetical protein
MGKTGRRIQIAPLYVNCQGSHHMSTDFGTKLRPRVRAVGEVAQFHDLPIKETAKVLDISVAAAKGRFCHARAQLRKSLALRAIARPLTEPRHEFAPCGQDWFDIPGRNERSGFSDCSDPNRSCARGVPPGMKIAVITLSL